MLPRPHRMVSAEDFRRTTRQGRRAGSRTLVVYAAWAAAGSSAVGVPGSVPEPATRIGFIVSRAVGNAVVRNRVKRRLRHLVRDRLIAFPTGGLVVVRALGASATASYAALARDLDRGLARVAP